MKRNIKYCHCIIEWTTVIQNLGLFRCLICLTNDYYQLKIRYDMKNQKKLDQNRSSKIVVIVKLIAGCYYLEVS